MIILAMLCTFLVVAVFLIWLGAKSDPLLKKWTCYRGGAVVIDGVYTRATKLVEGSQMVRIEDGGKTRLVTVDECTVERADDR